MRRLIAEGRARPAGIAAFEARRAGSSAPYSYENRPAKLPDDYLARLRANSNAWSWWQSQSPSYRRGATRWVVSAKQEATRQRRLEQLIADSAAGRAIPPMLVTREQRARG
ncbi:MAG TPA: YdeI/OmpD-associated family protein [Candidatus Limnocylindria bacterium]|nr:YdeI/OmpD-associated family protein [Candidatus Limnocylindria bacterium]